MSYRGRWFAAIIVVSFNVIRYVYYQQYLNYPFEKSFFILTAIFFAVAYGAGRQYDIAKFYADKDPLTNTYNRRTVSREFAKLASFCRVNNKRLGVVLIDLDNFKSVNDTFGHQKGDELLRQTADSIKMHATKNDLIVRWGGDEFVLLIPDFKLENRAAYIQSLRRELSQAKNMGITAVSASVGIAVYPDDGESFEVLIQQADASMYGMKESLDHVSKEGAVC